jgi:N,N-dimethylformamidase beta subunit-like, C-terminal
MDDARITPDVYGYTDRWDYRPGETLALSLHAATEQEAEVALVRLHGADERVSVARPLEEPVAALDLVQIGPQEVRPGSYGIAYGLPGVTGLECWLCPTAPEREQGVAGTLDDGERSGIGLVLDGRGRLAVRVGSVGEVCATPEPLRADEWIHAALVVGEEVELVVEARHPLLGSPLPVASLTVPLPDGANPLGAGDVRFGAAADGGPTFEGKLEAVVAHRGGELLAAWDLGSDPAGDRVADTGQGSHDAVLVNHPTRAVTGQSWSGRELDFRHAANEYAAVHFHSDDLDDLRWPPCLELDLPAYLASGIYALQVRAPSGTDQIPFFVGPGGGERPAVAFLAPTFTYQAYANARLGDRIDYAGDGLSAREYVPGPRDAQLDAHPVFAGSLYDIHSDGSGRAYSTHRRPVFNFRADYESAVQQAYRHVGADLYLTAWLESLDVDHDVLADHALDEHGAELLAPYRVLVTGSHPEYVSAAILDAIEAFLAGGGRVMYLGANGFYWITSRDGHWIETRRGRGSTRTWASRPGEEHHSTTGEPGGLWRHRGRAPNRLVGIGMTSQGWDERAPGFVRTPQSHDPRRAWVFDGVDGDVFGTEGLVMGGASGDELDRHDPALGSPPEEWIVATSQPHSKYYKGVLEDLLMLRDGLGGDENPDVRSDVVCYPTPGGGAVFSVGAISWAGAMAFADFANPVARITTNVLRRFLDAEDPFA